MHARNTLFLGLALGGALGCSGAVDPTDAPAAAQEIAPLRARPHGRGHEARTFMTRNVYLGAAVEPVLGAGSPEEVPVLVAQAWAEMEANDFSVRASALAKEIAEASPDVVGLQEVALFRRYTQTGDVIEVDFLSILRDALAARGLRYEAATVQQDSDVLVPMFAGFDPQGAPILDGVELMDRDLVLVRAGVNATRPAAARYGAGLPISMGGASIEIVRGWASVVVETDEGPFRFVTTHLEDQVPEIQLAQVTELLEMLAAEPLPVVLVGDFNSPADRSGTTTYDLLVQSGLVDAWAQAHPRDPGYTCCQTSNLAESVPFTQRLDLIFARGARGCREPRIPGVVRASIVGNEPKDRAPSGLWPSDHAGVVASFEMPFASTR